MYGCLDKVLIMTVGRVRAQTFEPVIYDEFFDALPMPSQLQSNLHPSASTKLYWLLNAVTAVNGFPRDVLDSTVGEIWTLDLSVTSLISLITEPSMCVRIKFGRSEIDRHLARHTKKLHRKGRLRLSALNSAFTDVLCYVMYLKNSAIFDWSMSLLRVLRYSRNALYYGITNNLMHLKARHLYSTTSGIPQLQYRFCVTERGYSQ